MVISSSSPELATPLEALVRSHHADGTALIERERRAHFVGAAAYWLMIVTSLTGVALIVRTYYADLGSIPSVQARMLAFIGTIVSTNWIAVTARTVWRYPWLLGGALLALLITLRVDRHLDARYSEFWHGLRAPLRQIVERRSG
jgi:hypothetical protein